ncbi:MAG: hypothetical protein ACTSV7_04770, partial [Candidatus Baldrarchaeia archaeon]
NHKIGDVVESEYHIEFSTFLSVDPTFLNVTIEWGGNKTPTTFTYATVTIFSGTFLMENGSEKRIYFEDDPYQSNFSPIRSKIGAAYYCLYSVNLTRITKKAAVKFYNKLGLSSSQLVRLSGRMFFACSGASTIKESGEERRFEFSFHNRKANLFLYGLTVLIPENCEFIGSPTLNGVKMNKILKRVEGFVTTTPYALESYKTTVEWKIPKIIPFWETPPVSWILSALVGGIIVSIPISLLSSYLWHRVRRPKLTIEVVPKTKKEPSVHPKMGIAFYHLVVKNNGKTTAYDSEVFISFKDMHGNELFSLNGKWDRGPEPLGPVEKEGKSKIWAGLIPASELINIRPGIPETFCLVVKDNEEPCYAFNAYSYFHNFKNPNWQLPVGKYIAEVTIKSGNIKKTSKFLVENKGTSIFDVDILKLE